MNVGPPVRSAEDDARPALTDQIANAALASSPILIRGPFRVGKTTAGWLAGNRLHTDHNFLHFYSDLSSVNDDRSLRSRLASDLSRQANRFSLPDLAAAFETSENPLDSLDQWCGRERRRAVVVIDENLLLAAENPLLFAEFARQVHSFQHLCAIVIVHYMHTIEAAVASLFASAALFWVQPLTYPETKTYVRKLVADSDACFAGVSNKFLSRLFGETAGRPIEINLLLRELAEETKEVAAPVPLTGARLAPDWIRRFYSMQQGMHRSLLDGDGFFSPTQQQLVIAATQRPIAVAEVDETVYRPLIDIGWIGIEGGLLCIQGGRLRYEIETKVYVDGLLKRE